MIKEIRLRFGRTPESEVEKFGSTPVTIFVGPNNSGKSLILQELHRYCHTGVQSQKNLLIDSMVFDELTKEEALKKLAECELSHLPDECLMEGSVVVGKRGGRIYGQKEQLLRCLEQPNSHPADYAQFFLQSDNLMLSGSTRINLVDEQEGGDLQEPPSTSMQLLFRDETKRTEVRRIVFEAFGRHLVIDPTKLGKLNVKLSNTAPESSDFERSLSEAAIAYFNEALAVQGMSDGVRAYTGIVMEMVAGDPAILLMDEPEAFLHPSLAFSLGREAALACSKAHKRLFASTHSPQFLMGVIQSGVPATIVRLTYQSGKATARILPSASLLKLMRNPLLRSSGTLTGLFYEFVIVTESDADRAFYQEINERLLRFMPEWGIPNCLFIHSQNKQTLKTIIKPLRGLGIPTAGIVDVDVLKDGGGVWTELLSSVNIPELEHQALGTIRAAIKGECESTGKNMKRDGGVAILQKAQREAADNLFDKLAQYGLFVVRGGELESWLPQLEATGHGPQWLIDMFSKMGEDADMQNYVRPSVNDVWSFVSEIRKWFLDSSRRGIPT